HVIVDIASPPTGGLSLINLYVTLSQSQGQSSIHLDLDEMTKHWWEKNGASSNIIDRCNVRCLS
ncbi:hypothetical protein J3A83DRAFT_4099776, partial [Scleroderma citrinum]